MIAFVMSGGGNRGAMEAGALLALFEAGISPDILVGTSAGSINAAYIATDPSLAGARRLVDTATQSHQSDFFPGGKVAMLGRLVRGRSLFPSDGLRAMLDRHLPPDKRRFGDLRGVRLYITAANLTTGTLYLYGDRPDASLIDAVIASAAHPLAYPPVRFGNYQLVDGGVIANVPVGIAVDKGATEIYVINVGYSGELAAAQGTVFQVLMRSITMMMYQHFLMDLKYVLENREVVLHHIAIKGFANCPMWDMSHSAEMVDVGHKATQDYLRSPLGLESVPVAAFGESEEPAPEGAEVYVPSYFSPSDLLGLPERERQVTTYLGRFGDADPATIAQALGLTLAQVRIDLASLAKKGSVQRLPDGKVKLIFGGRSRRRDLPSEFWDALSEAPQTEDA